MKRFVSAQGCLTRRPQQSLSDGMLVSQGQSQGTQHLDRSREPLLWGAGGVQRRDFRLPHLYSFPQTDALLYLQKPHSQVCWGPWPDFSFLRMVKGLFDDCFYSPIKPPWSCLQASEHS